MPEVWAPPGQMYTTTRMWRIHNDSKKTTNVLTAKETMALVLELASYGRKKKITKLKHTQNITSLEARRIVETIKYAEVTKIISEHPKNKAVMCETSKTTQPEVVAQLVNKMRVLIQEMKTIIIAVTWKTLKRPKYQSICNKPRKTVTGRAQGTSLLRWLLSLAHYRSYLKGKLQGKPSPNR